MQKFDKVLKKWYNILVAFKGGNKFNMKNNDKASISLRKIICISIIFIFIMTVVVSATNMKLNNVKIILASGYEMNVLTSKKKIAEILDENHIIVLEDEKVVPSLEQDLPDNNTIKISKSTEEEIELPDVIETSSDITIEQILQSYDTIVEKIVIEKVKIPYETITKNVASGSKAKQDKIVQYGVDGLKEVTYKVKYQNEKEIEKKEISSKIIRKPVDKIVEVRNKQQITSRSSQTVRYAGKWSYSDAELDLLCAITAQECSSSYNGSLAVITTACNRAQSSKWKSRGSDPLSQYKAKGQFCYSIDNHWKKRLNGKYPAHVKQAVIDALNGKRNHNYLSFRARGYANGVNIGGNVYFNAM